jgi:hypothetical protein
MVVGVMLLVVIVALSFEIRNRMGVRMDNCDRNRLVTATAGLI